MEEEYREDEYLEEEYLEEERPEEERPEKKKKLPKLPPVDLSKPVDGNTTRRLRAELRKRELVLGDAVHLREMYGVEEDTELFIPFSEFVHRMENEHGVPVSRTIKLSGGERHLLEPAIEELRVYYKGNRKFLRREGLEIAEEFLLQNAGGHAVKQHSDDELPAEPEAVQKMTKKQLISLLHKLGGSPTTTMNKQKLVEAVNELLEFGE